MLILVFIFIPSNCKHPTDMLNICNEPCTYSQQYRYPDANYYIGMQQNQIKILLLNEILRNNEEMIWSRYICR